MTAFQMAARMSVARDTARTLFGSSYDEKVKPYRDAILARKEKDASEAITAMLAIAKELKPNGATLALLLAATCDIVESPQRDPLFIGVYPAGLVYADRTREVDGDYKRLAFLSYETLVLNLEKDCPPHLAARITKHAATLQARKGQDFRIGAAGQTVTLGTR